MAEKMKTVLWPRAQLLAKTLLEDQLPLFYCNLTVHTKNPDDRPKGWIRLWSNGGEPLYAKSTWNVHIGLWVYGEDESQAEADANLVLSLMMDAPGVGITLPEGPDDYVWVQSSQYISGPASIGDEDLSNLERWQIFVMWRLLPIP